MHHAPSHPPGCLSPSLLSPSLPGLLSGAVKAEENFDTIAELLSGSAPKSVTPGGGGGKGGGVGVKEEEGSAQAVSDEGLTLADAVKRRKKPGGKWG